MNIYLIKAVLEKGILMKSERQSNAISLFMDYLEKSFPIGNFFKTFSGYEHILISDIKINPEKLKKLFIIHHNKYRPLIGEINIELLKEDLTYNDAIEIQKNIIPTNSYYSVGSKCKKVFYNKELWCSVGNYYEEKWRWK